MVPCQRIWDSGNNSYHECDLPAGITATCPQGRAGWWELPSVRRHDLIARLLLALAAKGTDILETYSSCILPCKLRRNHRWSRVHHENCSWSACFWLLTCSHQTTTANCIDSLPKAPTLTPCCPHRLDPAPAVNPARRRSSRSWPTSPAAAVAPATAVRSPWPSWQPSRRRRVPQGGRDGRWRLVKGLVWRYNVV